MPHPERAIHEVFSDKGLWLGDQLYIGRQHCSDLLGYCLSSRIGILGLDGFLIHSGVLHLQDDCIADLSPVFHDSAEWELLMQRSIAETSSFIGGRAPLPLHYEFVFYSEEEWRSGLCKIARLNWAGKETYPW